MKKTIYINTEKVEYSIYCGEVDSYTRKFTIGSFDVEAENEKELNKFIEFLNFRDSGVTYSLNCEGLSEVLLNSDSFLVEIDKWRGYLDSEKSRLEKNREIRKEISKLKAEIKELKSSIK